MIDGAQILCAAILCHAIEPALAVGDDTGLRLGRPGLAVEPRQDGFGPGPIAAFRRGQFENDAVIFRAAAAGRAVKRAGGILENAADRG